MSASTATDTPAKLILSRRDAIIGGIAMAAAALFARKPDTASAANGSPVVVGGLHAGTQATIFWRTDTGNLGQIYSQAMLSGPDPASGQHRGLDGQVYGFGGSDAVGVRGSAAGAGQYGVVA